jgi:hypothetical protein
MNNKQTQIVNSGLQNGKGRYWKLVRHVVNTHKPGDVIDDTEIEKVIGIDKTITDAKTKELHANNRYTSVCNNANKKLTQLQMRLKRVKGVGYRVLYLNEYGEDAMNGNFMKAYNLLNCAKKTLDCVPLNKLSNSDKAKMTDYKTDCFDVERAFANTYKFKSAMNKIHKGGKP